MGRRLTLETLFAAALAGGGVAVAAISWGYGFGTLARPGPGLYPFFVGLAIAVFALIILAADFRNADSRAQLDRAGARRLALMSAIFCFWIAAMPLLGYVVVTSIATYAFARTLALEGRAKPIALAAGTALFVYLLFDQWLYIDLPRGVLG